MPPDHDPLAPRALALRALTHPLRWKLIDLLNSEQSATATRCAEVLGESVASCGYHLSILAKYGYVEPVPDRAGREKPWRLASRRQDLSTGGLDEAGTLVAEAAIEVFLDHELERIKDRLRRAALEPAEWQAASSISGSTKWMTAAELAEIKDQLAEIQERYGDRDGDPAARPPGAREVRVFAVTSVAPRLPSPPRAEARTAEAGTVTEAGAG
jgi:predicted ArsR family transcriptional regulator